jgi:hypothetical protein
MTNRAQQEHHLAKIQEAKRRLEENEGKRIKADKIVEWALLEIAQQLQAIHQQLIFFQQSLARPR